MRGKRAAKENKLKKEIEYRMGMINTVNRCSLKRQEGI